MNDTKILPPHPSFKLKKTSLEHTTFLTYANEELHGGFLSCTCEILKQQ